MLIAPNEDAVPDEEQVQIEDEEEAEVRQHAHDPGQPTERQIQEHRVCHVPFRSWCKQCVLGRGRGIPHRRGHESSVPIIGLDYFFITASGVKTAQELSEELEADPDTTPRANATEETNVERARTRGDAIKCLMVRCSATKCIFAHIVPHKGVDEANTVADMVLNDVEWLGHSRLIFKSDGEPAIQALVQRVVELAKVEIQTLDQVGKEKSAAHDSQSNGSTEVGIQQVRGLYRTLRLCLEERLNKTIPPSHAITSWLLEHTSLVYNTMVRGDDGLTAWARARGRSFRQQLLAFGESVLYRHPAKGPQHSPDGNMGALGGEGVFLGYSRSSNTFVVGTDDGRIINARSISRRPERQRWDPDRLAAVHLLPVVGQRARPEAPRTHLEPATDGSPAPQDPGRPSTLRRMRITKADLEKYGYHSSCPQCKHIQTYGKPQAGKNHSDQCRRQLTDAMSKTEQGRQRLAGDEERLDRRTAEHLKHADRAASTPKPAAASGTYAPSAAARGFLERPTPRDPHDAQPAPMPRQPREPHPTDAAIPPPQRHVRVQDPEHPRDTGGASSSGDRAGEAPAPPVASLEPSVEVQPHEMDTEGQ